MPFAKIPVTKMKGFLEGHTSSPGTVPTAAYSAYSERHHSTNKQ